MKDRIFLDTNIFVYSLDCSDLNKLEISKGIIRSGLFNKNCFVSYQVVQELGNVLTKKIKPKMDMISVNSFFSYSVYPFLSFFPDQSFYNLGLELHFKNNLSFYDSLIICAAQALKCNLLFSEDLQHGQKFNNLKIVNPYS